MHEILVRRPSGRLSLARSFQERRLKGIQVVMHPMFGAHGLLQSVGRTVLQFGCLGTGPLLGQALHNTCSSPRTGAPASLQPHSCPGGKLKSSVFAGRLQ